MSLSLSHEYIISHQARAERPEQKGDGMNSSLRSFFPVELVDDILSHLDQSSLASLCAVSYRSLEEAGPHLMRHVDITDWTGLAAFFLRPSLPSSSRLQPHLQTSQMRTLDVRVPSRSFPDDATSQISVDQSQRRAVPLAHPLLRLTLTHPEWPTIEPLFLQFFSRFNPLHLELLSVQDRDESRFHGGWWAGLPFAYSYRSWTSLRRVTCLGWVPISTLHGPPAWCLARLPPSEASLDLELDLRGWSSSEHALLLPALSHSGTLGIGRLKAVRWAISEAEESTVREALAKLSHAERDKVELIVV